MSAIELRQVEPGGPIQLSGYASLVEKPYEVGKFVEVIRRGSFRRSLSEKPDVALLLGHAGLGLASTIGVDGAEPTLTLSEDEMGLRVDAELAADDPEARELKVKARQAPLEMSMGFRATRQKWDEGYENREISEVSLHRGDVSVVGRAAAAATQGLVSLRGHTSLEQRKQVAERLGQRIVSGLWIDSPTLTVARAAVAPPSGVEIARARRAKAIAEGGKDGPRYTDREIEELGERGYALKKKSGRGYHFPIVDGQDVTDAVKAWARANPSERPTAKAWIIKRAIILRVTRRLPEDWQPK